MTTTSSTRRPARRAAATLVAAAALLGAVAGCGLLPEPGEFGSGLVDGAVRGLNENRDTLAAAVRPAVRAAVEEAAGTIADSMRPVLDSTVAALLRTAGAGAADAERQLAEFIQGELNRAATTLVGANLELLERSIREAVDAWIETAGRSAQANLVPVAGAATSLAAEQGLGSLTAGLAGGELRRTVVGLADSVVTQAIAAIARESERNTPWWLYALGIGFALVVLAAVGGFIIRLKRALRQRERSLQVVTMAIKDQRNVAVKERVRELATRQGVEPWLHAYLRDQGLLLEDRIPAGGG